jgi:hypothetical protein
MFVIIGVLLAATAAQADTADRNKCIRENTKVFGEVNAKRICDPRNYVSDPNEYGWVCSSPVREKGMGAKQKKDMICD